MADVSVNDVIQAQSGPYKWKERDCISTAKAIADFICCGESGVDYPPWVKDTEAATMAHAKSAFGSLDAAWREVFGHLDGVVKVAGDEWSPVPGDVVVLGGFIEVAAAEWDADKRGAILGFVSDAFDVWTWASFGLYPATGDYKVKEAYRWRKSR